MALLRQLEHPLLAARLWIERRPAAEGRDGDDAFGAAGERHQANERSIVAADLAGRVLQSLTPDDQLVLTMIDGEDASIKDVAQMTGWSESKVKVQVFRARRRMRQAVERLLQKPWRAGAKLRGGISN